MRCDTCQQESPVVMRVVVAKDYNRALARPVYNCPACFEKKEQTRPYAQGAATRTPVASAPGPSRTGSRGSAKTLSSRKKRGAR